MEFLDSHCLLENEKAELQNSDSNKEIIESALDFLQELLGSFPFPPAIMQGMFPSPTRQLDKACARLQGKGQLERHFEKSIFERDSDEYLPVGRDDSKAMVKQRTLGSRIGNQII
uniref:Uncharacterized protein n=1 Tax=Populus trichocarpa TaxID=3694 RepID=A0A2K1Z6T2_POPTR